MTNTWSPVFYENTQGHSPIVLVCEHASNLMPTDFAELGLDDGAQNSHAAWDIGALDVARKLASELDAPLAACGVSRLLYDCNRPPSAKNCIPSKSERFDIPGNANLDGAQRLARQHLIHDPFHAAVDGLIRAHSAKVAGPIVVVTIHTFTPIYFGRRRDVEIGFLHHDNAELSIAVQKAEQKRGTYKTALNEPYDASDGVTYSVAKHADCNGLHSTMIEVRNDLVNTQAKAQSVSVHLAETLERSIARILPPMETAS